MHISIALIQRAWAHASISSEPVEALNTLMWPVPKPPMIKSFSKQTDEQGNLTKIKIFKGHISSEIICVYSNTFKHSPLCTQSHQNTKWSYRRGTQNNLAKCRLSLVIITCLQISICLKWQCRMRASSPIMSSEVSRERTGQWAREGGKYSCHLSGAALAQLLATLPKGEPAHRLMKMLTLL